MGEAMKWRALLAIAAAAAVLTGCGGDSATGEAGGTAKDSPAGYPRGPTRQFIAPGGDNAVPLYGHEASGNNRRQASAVLERWMRARQAKDFDKECRYFSRTFIKRFVAGDAKQVSRGRVQSCPQALAYFGAKASGDFKDTLGGGIASLRVSGDEGFAQYHGNDGIDYEIPMHREGGRWLVSMAAPIEEEG